MRSNAPVYDLPDDVFFAGLGTERFPARDGNATNNRKGVWAAVTLPAKPPFPADLTTDVSWSVACLFGDASPAIFAKLEVGIRYAPTFSSELFIYATGSSLLDPASDDRTIVDPAVRPFTWGDIVYLQLLAVDEPGGRSVWTGSYYDSDFSSDENVFFDWDCWYQPNTLAGTDLLGGAIPSFMYTVGQTVRSESGALPLFQPRRKVNGVWYPDGYCPRFSEIALNEGDPLIWLPWTEALDASTWEFADSPYVLSWKDRRSDFSILTTPPNETVEFDG